LDLARCLRVIDELEPIKKTGHVVQVVGLVIESLGPEAELGELCLIRTRDGKVIQSEVVGFRERQTLLMPLGEMNGLHPGAEVIATGSCQKVKVGPNLVGRILDGLGNPIDGAEAPETTEFYPVMGQPPNPMSRPRIKEPLSVGVKAIDGVLTIGRGQRMGIMAGSGVGKSTLLGMIARNTAADVNVIALIGERGREVREFIEKDLGTEGLQRSVVVVATSDKPALVRLKGGMVATAIAEYFRDQGHDVMFMMDSITRFAMAQREVGLTIGEPPATRGYTPSVFALLPRFLERSGAAPKGTITGLYTVLVEGDDFNEPITDTVRGVLDGHIVLSRELATRNHYPAIDILGSVSRVMIDIVPSLHQVKANALREVLAIYREARDLVDIGAYKKGSNPRIDYALDIIGPAEEFLRQGIGEKIAFEESVELLGRLFPEGGR